MKIEITHIRRYYSVDRDEFYLADVPLDEKDILQPTGGITVADAISETGDHMHLETARCSEKDNYNKRLGRTIAEGRVMCHLTGEAKRRQDRKYWLEKPNYLPAFG